MHALKYSFSLSLFLFSFWAMPASAVDISAGEQKSSTCAGCHGPKGKSSNGQWPNLAAQQSVYLVNQLKAFKAGERSNPMMQSMAANLSDEDINNLAAYYAGLPAVSAGGDTKLVEAGETIAVTVCTGCHGTTGGGADQFPRLAGQHSDYLVKQLDNFKTGERKHGQMQAVAASLSEEDMKAVAAYFASLK